MNTQVMNATLPRWIAATAVVAALAFPAGAGELAARGDFENGNVVVVAVDQQARSVTIAPQPVRQCRNLWWHVRLTGIRPGETVELRVVDFDPVAGEVHPVYSYDGTTWNRMQSRRSPHRQVFSETSVSIARNIPYTYTDSLRLAERLARLPCVGSHHLCASEEGRSVKLLRITDPGTADDGKKVVWVQARQHAFESHSSRVAEGLAIWVAGDAERAARLRRRAVVCVVPIMDVDGVAAGGAGKDQKPVDFNRCWGEDAHWIAVRSAVELLDRQTREHELVAFLDLHSPWYANTNHWYLPKPAPLQEQARAFAELFAAAVQSSGGANSWKNRFVDPPGSEQTRSRNFAVSRWIAPTGCGVSMTQETAHWKDNDGEFITAQGLLDYGRALGLALFEWVHQQEPPDT